MKIKKTVFKLFILNMYLMLIILNDLSIIYASTTKTNNSRLTKSNTMNVQSFGQTDAYNINHSSQCGLKPVPNIGCQIGKCVNGYWKQLCSSPDLECGFKPIPNVGCKLGKCVNGAWEQICEGLPPQDCGFKPIPIEGCKIDKCVNGSWQQECKPYELKCGFQPLPNEGCKIGKCVNGSWEQICE